MDRKERNIFILTGDLYEEAEESTDALFYRRDEPLDELLTDDGFFVGEKVADFNNTSPETRLIAKEMLDIIDSCISSVNIQNRQLYADLIANEIIPLIMDDEELLEYAYRNIFNSDSVWIAEWYACEGKTKSCYENIAKVHKVSVMHCIDLKNKIMKQIRFQMELKGYGKRDIYWEVL